MLQLIDDQTASNYYNEIDTATGDDLQSKTVALEAWANNKKAERTRQEWDHVSKVFTDFDNYSAAEGLNDFDEESRYQYANRKFIANQTGDTPENQMFVYPSKRDEVTDKLFGKTGLSEKEAFDLFKHSVESRTASEEALRELPGVLAQGVLKRAGEGKPFDEVDSWFAFSDWKDRHADKLASMPKGWETAMLDSAVKLHARTEQLIDDVAPESKRAMDTLMKFTRPEDAANLPEADRADVENLAKDFAKLTPEKREGIYATLSYAAEAGGAGMGKGFWEKVGEGMARGGGNIYDDAAMTAQDRQARQNISFFQDLIDKPQAEPDTMQTADSIQMQRDMAQKGLEENKQRLGELRVMREIRDLAQGRIDPIKTEMDGVLGSVVQGAYDFSQSAAYTGMAMVPYVGLPAVMGALANSNYLRMLDQYPDMDADAAFDLSLAIAGPQAVIERFQGGLLLGKLPFLGKAMKKLTDVRVPLPVRIGLGFGAVVGLETGTELIQEAMPVVADQLAAAVREDMPEFDAGKAWGAYRDQAPKIFYSMLWGGLMGGGAVGIRELERSGVYMRNLQELEMHGITGEAAQNIAAEQDQDAATTLYREAWDKRSPEDIQAGIAKRAAMLDAAQATQANPDLPTRRVEQAPDGTTTHIIEQNGQAVYRTSDPAAADMALINITRMMDRSRITGTTTGIVESMQFIDQVKQATNRGEDVQKLLLDGAPRTLFDDYEANPTEQNLDNLFSTVREFGYDISEPAELANFPVLASNQGALAEGIFKSVIRIQDGATGVEVMRDFSQDNLKRAIGEGRVTMDWVREQLNQVIPLIESDRIEGRKLSTETDTGVIESFSDVAVAYMTGRIRDEQIQAGFRGFLRRIAIVVKDIFRRAYRLKRAISEGKVDANFESFLADSVGLNQQARVDTASSRVSKDIITDGGQILMDFSIGSRASAVSTDTPSIRASNATITGPANYSIGAFHGTPHKVDKFSTEKIGTGEGAQAYGWGLYFAENKGVAEQYQKNIKPEWQVTPTADGFRAMVLDANLKPKTAANFKTEAEATQWAENETGYKGGNFYTVDLDVEPEDLLDWDKPFSEQSPKVQAALKAVQSDNPLWKDTISGKNGKPVGGAIYKTLTATWPDSEFASDGIDPKKKASDALLAAGIPGIRYLDGGSRSEGQGTYNYVAFDENLIKITEENGNRIAATDALAAPATGVTNYSIGAAPVKVSIEGLSEKPVQAREQIRSYIQKFLQGKELVLGDTDKKVRFTSESRGESISKARRVNQMAPMREAESIVAAAQWWKKTAPDDRAKIGTKEFWFFKVPIEIEGVVYNSHFNVRVPNAYPENTGVFYEFNLGKKIESNAAMGLEESSAPSFVDSEINIGTSATEVNPPLSNYSIGLSRNAISQVSDKDDPFRVGTAKLGTSKVPKNTPQDSNISGDNVPDDLLAKQMEKMNYAHLPKNILSEKDPKKKRRKLINWFKKNLLALHDAFPEEFRARATHWYDGANRIAKEMGSQFKASTEQASGVIAVFSPQKDWFMNVAQAEQFMELWTNSQDVVLEESLVRAEIEGIIEAATAPDKQKRKKVTGETKEQTAERREYNKALDERAKVDRRKKVEQVIGKTIRQLDAEPDLQGWAIRVLAQITFGRNYRNLSPEGDRLGMATNDDGALAKSGWGSINEIEKAVRIMKDGSLKNISDNLGNEHKVRNFYNNIVAPNTPYGDATIDTHAVAAAHLMPYGAKATEVGHNFGSGMNGSEVLGISGVYHLYLDAYREAAADRGILPRQMQSITWEAIRLVYPAATKNATTLAKSQKTWEDLTDDSARNTLVGGRIPSPVWAGANDNRESQSNPTGLGENIGQEGVSGGSLLSGVRPAGAGRDGGVNYSIASQSEIDRVNRALGGMNRGPDERLKVYQRARQKFSRVMQENKEQLDAIRSAVSTNTAPAIEQIEMDRAGKIADIEAEENTEVAKALQDNADTFLPRIEAAPTPAERKRVERDAKDRAKILEQGILDKYAERKKSTDAEAKSQRDQTLQAAAAKDSAANARMREKVRQTKLVDAIGELDGILEALPPEVRGRVGGFAVLANIGTGDKALADFFVKRIDMIDRQLERTLKEEYGNVFDALLERTKPKKAAAGEKPKGIGADIQSLFAVVREARDWSAEKVDGHIANIETQIASGNLTAQEEAMLTREADLVSLVGDWKNADSSRRAAALSAATETWAKGMSTFVQKKIREREDRDMARAEAISATGKKGDYVGRRKRVSEDNGLRGKIHGWFMNTISWDQAVNVLFGHESPMAIRLSDGQRKAEYTKIDAIQAKEDALHDLFTKLAGGKRVDGERLMWKMSQPSISANGLNLSELEALAAPMMWAQEDGRRHMTGELDENGNPISKWHYDQQFIDDIESQLSPEAKTIRDFLLNNYGKEWFSINSVYREMNGINLPRIPNYSPITVAPINAPSGMVTDPVTGNAVSATSISPSALRTRGVAIAEPVFRNVIQTYIAHTRQMEHWKAFAPWIKEANGILRNRDVQNSIKEAGGEEATGVLNRYLDIFAQGGNRDASLGLEISKTMGGMFSRAAQVALVGRVGTLAIQTTQIGAASAELPVGAYLSRLGKLVTGNLGWGNAINSKYIQRRIKQMPPTVQIAMEGLKAGKPNELKHQVEKIGQLISGTDALWTAGTYAMVYDYQLGQAKALGYRGQSAEDYAHNIAERITDRLAQPTRMGTRSIYELTATNPGARLAWAFASESRKNLALLAYTKANRPLKRFLAATAGYVVFNLAMGALIRNAWKDMRDDGDDEDDFFDEKTWNWKRMGVAMLTEPLQGMPLLGDYTEKGINAALGQYHQSSDLINFERGIKSFKNIPDILQGERDAEGVLKDIDGMVSLMGLFNQNAAAAASLTHIASDFFGVVDNATTED